MFRSDLNLRADQPITVCSFGVGIFAIGNINSTNALCTVKFQVGIGAYSRKINTYMYRSITHASIAVSNS